MILPKAFGLQGFDPGRPCVPARGDFTRPETSTQFTQQRQPDTSLQTTAL